MREEKNNKSLRGIEILLFIVYLAMLCYFLFFAESLDRNFAQRMYHYNLVPLKEIRRFFVYRHTLDSWAVLLNLAGNVVAFIPFGFLLPELFKRCRKLYVTTLLGLEFSFFVELIQLVGKVGIFDVDDIILNTSGALLGYILYWLFQKVWRKKK